MSIFNLGLPGTGFQTELSTTQVPIALGVSGTFAVTGNIATLTFTAAHGLTYNPAAGTMPNYFGYFTGASAITGSGTLNGPIFRILNIPSTTTIQIYTTVTAATVTGASFVPVFLFPFTAMNASAFVNGPVQVGTQYPPALLSSGSAFVATGANCTVQYNPDNTSQIMDPSVATTIAAPTYRNVLAASSQGFVPFTSGPQVILAASGSAGTTRVSAVQ